MIAADAVPIETPLLIGGEERQTGSWLDVHDPSRRSVLVGRAAAASQADAHDAIAAAQAAWPAWAALSASERAERVGAALAGLETDADERVELLVRENGKIRFEAAAELRVVASRFREAIGLAPALDEPETIAGPPFASRIERLPVGVVTIIVPFNAPLAILAASLPFALLAGNTVVVKPPPTAPLAVVRTLAHLVRALPPGVLNVLTGEDGVIGSALVGDPRVKHVCFTGSVSVGRRIMESASANLTRVTLELGGNDPAIVLDDAVLDDAAFERIAAGAMRTTGQICMAIKRLYVPRSRLQEVCDGLQSTIARTRVGRGLDPTVTMGPLHTARQRAYVIELREEARAAGAAVLELGELVDEQPAEGNFLLPALVLDPGHDVRAVTEEQFGPLLPVIAYDSEDEALRRANDSWSGLCSSVWSADQERAMALARQLRTGVTFFNNHGAIAVDDRAPFGGFNQSGIGRELGREGLFAFTESHVMSVPS
jgi:acyl-CoA reductase-like NAD-dependent aldehyde dehydrogenase